MLQCHNPLTKEKHSGRDQPEKINALIKADRDKLASSFDAHKHTKCQCAQTLRMYKVLLVSGRMAASNQFDSFQATATLDSPRQRCTAPLNTGARTKDNQQVCNYLIHALMPAAPTSVPKAVYVFILCNCVDCVSNDLYFRIVFVYLIGISLYAFYFMF